MKEYKEGQILSFNIGQVVYKTPPMPKRNDILFHEQPKEKQKWKRPILSISNWDFLSTDEKIVIIKKDLHRREYGVWFFNNGEPTYITGDHYFYLTHWFIGADTYDGYPEYRYTNRLRAYHWDYAEKDRNSFGDMYLTNRRDGKTEFILAAHYNKTTLYENKHMGLQSISGADAKNNLFIDRVVRSWKKIHPDFKPINDDPDPKTILKFKEPVTKTKKTQHVSKYAINSWIDYEESKASAYQGKKLFRILLDEPGSMENMSLKDWWTTTKQCLAVGNKIIGKCSLPTTLEQATRKGFGDYTILWKSSDYNKKDANGRTQSGLLRYFKPGYMGVEGFIDEYGNDLLDTDGIPKAKKWLENQFAAADQHTLKTLKRQFPFTEAEALQPDDSKTVFPTQNIIDQIRYNETIPKSTVRRGNLIWVDRDNFLVEFRDDSDGRWLTSWLPPQDKRCKFQFATGGIKPFLETDNAGGVGIDPFDHDNTVSDKKSNGAFYYFRNFDIIEPFGSNCFVLEYINRPDTSRMFYDDVCKTLVFYGVSALVENQKSGLINYMKDNGFKNYIMQTQQGDYTKSDSRKYVDGISLSGVMAREALIDELHLYIYDYIGKIKKKTQIELGIPEKDVTGTLYGNCPFDLLLQDWLDFDIDKWTDYDATVASGLAKVAASRKRKKSKANYKKEIPKDLFKTYKL